MAKKAEYPKYPFRVTGVTYKCRKGHEHKTISAAMKCNKK